MHYYLGGNLKVIQAIPTVIFQGNSVLNLLFMPKYMSGFSLRSLYTDHTGLCHYMVESQKK